jgi:hypothetical protein
LTLTELFTQDSSSQAQQPIPHTTVRFYSDCVKTLPRILAGEKKLAVASRQRTISHFLFHQGIFLPKNNMSVITQPPHCSVSPTEDKTQRPPFLHIWGDWGRTVGGAEQPHRTQLPGCIYKMAEVHTCRRGLLWG